MTLLGHHTVGLITQKVGGPEVINISPSIEIVLGSQHQIMI